MVTRWVFSVCLFVSLSLRGAGIIDFPCFRTVDETYQSMVNLAEQYPHLVSLTNVGSTVEGTAILGVVLSNRTNGVPKYPVLFMGGIHSNELGPCELLIRWAEIMCANWGVEADSTMCIDYGEIHIIPILLVDQRMRRDLDPATQTRLNGRGVNINRNFPYKWGTVLDADPEDYGGPFAASEPETQAITNYMHQLFADWRGTGNLEKADTNATGAFFDLHTQAAKMLYPWSHTREAPPDAAGLATMARKVGFYTGYTPGQSYQTIGASSGTSASFGYGELGIPSFTWELGLLGRTNCDNFSGHVLPKNLPALLWAAKSARRPYIQSGAPEVTSVKIVVGSGTVSVSAVADDTRNGSDVNHPITAARCSIDQPTWLGGEVIPLTLTPNSTNPAIANITGQISTTSLSGGAHIIFIEAADTTFGIPTAAFFAVSDPGLPPAAPTGLAAVAGNGAVTLSWNAVAGVGISYRVGRSSDAAGPYETIAEGLTEPGYTDGTVDNGTTYYYVVAAWDGVRASAASDWVLATPEAPPPPPGPPQVSVVAIDAIAGESDTSEGSGSFMFSRTSSTAQELVVNFDLGGSATSAGDYRDMGSTVTFEAGSATATKTVEIIEDGLFEADETVTLTLLEGVGYIIGSPATATVAIKDDDEEIIIDNGSAVGMTFAGTWTASKTTPGYWATDYHHDGNAEKGGKTATFTPNLALGGVYQVFMRYPARSDYPNNVPVDIVHAEGTTTVNVNQRLNGARWNLLGTFSLNAGNSGYVKIRTDQTRGYVIADAVRFVRTASVLPQITIAATDPIAGEPGTGEGTGTFTFNRVGGIEANLTVNFTVTGTGLGGSDYEPLGATVTFAAGSTTVTKVLKVIDDAVSEQEESVTVTVTEGIGYRVGASSATVVIRDDEVDVIVDNAMTAAVTYAGTWKTSKTTPGYWGSNYHYDENSGKGEKTATFTPTLPGVGAYQVYMWYPARSDYPDNLPVDIVHAEGTTTLTVNQKINGRKWNLLGVYNFSAGNGEYVRIRTSGTVGYAVADAFKWVRVPGPVGTPQPQHTSKHRSAEVQVPLSIYIQNSGVCVEWPATPGLLYRVLSSSDGGVTWQQVFEAEASDSIMRFRTTPLQGSALFRVQGE